MNKRQLVVGIDYGSDSARAILVDARTGITVAESSMEYPRWKERKYCDSVIAQYRQHPLDYIEVLECIIRTVIAKAGEVAGCEIMGIAVDTTGSTVCPVDSEGLPLALLEEFAEEPDAMFHLWKDHTAVSEAKEIDSALSSGKIDYTKYQGKYSSEWFWAKILHTVRKNARIRKNAFTWVEHCDWIAALLTGKTAPAELVRGTCGAGHKVLWHSSFNGLPSRSCLAAIDPYLGDIFDRYPVSPQPAGTCIGTISMEWANKLGLTPDAKIGVGSFDAHAGAVGAGISKHTMVKVVGTSTVDLLIESEGVLADKKLRDFCGMAEDSIVPGYIGIEMGQPAFGDTYEWFRNILLWPLHDMDIPEDVLPPDMRRKLLDYYEHKLLSVLDEYALQIASNSVVALDWLNGRRYPKLNEYVKGAILGITLGVTAPELYDALVKGTVFGSKAIYDSLVNAGIQIKRLICVGGIAKKSPYIMQMMSDVLNIPIMVCEEDQNCARGAAIFAAVATGLYPDVESAQAKFCEPYQPNYFPRQNMHEEYEKEYISYLKLGNFVESNPA